MTGPSAVGGGLGVPLARVLAICAVMLCGVVAAAVMKPTTRLAEVRPAIKLDRQVPKQFGDWVEDRSIVPVLPDPTLQATLDALYSQVLARTYINSEGKRIMLSIAYGSDQSSEATAVHRPEFCFSAQGFKVEGAGIASVETGGGPIEVQRLVARIGQRVEPISYWVTLDDRATLPGLGRKLEQLRFGFKGQIADGMLVRLSSIGSDQASAYALQDAFIRDLRKALDPDIRERYFGKATP